MASRHAEFTRKTSETQIEVFIDLDGGAPGHSNPPIIKISTGIGFLDHVGYKMPSSQPSVAHGAL
jgi:imidazoleglycerol phosphate dehydratase HisB